MLLPSQSQAHYFLSINKFVLFAQKTQSTADEEAIRQTQANHMDFTDIIPGILANGLIAGASNDLRQLLDDQNLQNAVPMFREALTQVVQINLNMVDQLQLSRAACTVEPNRRSRQAIETARDTGFGCLQQLLANSQATTEYEGCIQQMITQARTDIEALRPAIESCLHITSTTQMSTNGI